MHQRHPGQLEFEANSLGFHYTLRSAQNDAQQQNIAYVPGPDSARRRLSVFEFVDSTDPNVRRAIQRHTAYHSAAKRREKRSRLLDRSKQARYLEWGRRPWMILEAGSLDGSTTSSELKSPASSNSDRLDLASVSFNNSAWGTYPPGSVTAQSDAAVNSSMMPRTAISDEDPVLQYRGSDQHLSTISHPQQLITGLGSVNFCHHYRQRDSLDKALAYMREHQASRNLLLAYAYASRLRLNSCPESVQDRVDAQTHLGWGINILWKQLHGADRACSDSNIQAVLLLMVYTPDFGQTNEIRLHTHALQTMIEQRGGIGAFGRNPALQHQLRSIGQSREHHLTFDCEPSCPSRLRFSSRFDSLTLLNGLKMER
ncbi:hypothetical protein H2204_015186 [Knufia peltigerae]|nr:hypothetical protein H2204_015186 [Knufia peltigerae]